MQQEHIREAVGVFDTIANLNEAVAELEVTAFPRDAISILGQEPEPGLSGDKLAMDAQYLEDNPDAPRAILVRPEEMTIGMAVLVGGGVYAGVLTALLMAGQGASFLAVTIMSVLGGLFGGALGGLAAWMLGHYYSEVLRQQIKRGRMLLWVRTPNPGQEQLACDIMHRHGGRRVHIHELTH